MQAKTHDETTYYEMPTPALLTRREREVACLLARGYTNREIATNLVITEGSAHVQVARLLNKLGFHTRSRVAAWAVIQGLYAPALEAKGYAEHR